MANPSDVDPDIAAVRAASRATVHALLTRDSKGFGASHAPGCMINSPANRVIDREQASRAFDAGLIDYETFDRHVDHIGKCGPGLVVEMGEEVMTPRGRAADAGKVVRRRFTDVWQNFGGEWKIIIRHATVISVV